MRNSLFLLAFTAIFSCACSSLRSPGGGEEESLERLYRQAIQQAIYPDSGKVYGGLIPIVRENDGLVWKEIEGEDYLLVVTWKQNITYYQPYLDSAYFNTGSYPIWVTAAPQLQEHLRKEPPEKVDLRLKQLLGLPPHSVYSYFVEFWVKPTDLFRPCPDREVTDNKCDLCFPEGTDADHIAWINENRVSRYYQCDWFDQYPWTQLGYTYDWNPENTSHVGLSEYVIGMGKNVVVKAIHTTDDYLKKARMEE